MTDIEAERWTGSGVESVKRWSLLTGGRFRLAMGIAVGIGVLTWLLIRAGVVYVGPGSNLRTVLASGMLGGLATVVTVTLSINQLILSRVFGAPANLTDRLEGNLAFRRTVEDIAGVDVSPNDPGSFLALLGRALEERAASLQRSVEEGDVAEGFGDDVDDLATDLVAFARHLRSAEDSDSTFEVLVLTFGTTYADLIDDARGFRRTTEGRLPDDAADDLDAILELLKGVATIRQFFKTLAVQQDLASLSRQLIYTGLPALLVTFYLAQVYVPATAPVTIPAARLPAVVAAASVVVFAPVALLASTLLRVATVTLYTVSVGSFIPPEERIGRS